LECANDEDDSDESCKQFLCKLCDEHDEVGPVEHGDEEQDQAHPDADPKAEREVVETVRSIKNVNDKLFSY
jgi:hypothetical protein